MMSREEIQLVKDLQSTAGGLPSLSVSKIRAALDAYLVQMAREKKAVDHYRARLRWFTRWLDASGISSTGLLYLDDFVVFELWLRSAKSPRGQILVSQPLRQEILKRLRGALRWANMHRHLSDDYSVWVPAAHMDDTSPGVEEKAPALPYAPVVIDNNITTANLRTWHVMFCVAKEGQGIAERTLTWYRSRLDSYLTWIDSHEGLNPTNAVAFEYYLAYQQKINSKATVKSTFTAIRTFFNWLIKRRIIRHDDAPTKMVNTPKLPKKRMRYITTDEFEVLYSSIKGTGWSDWRDRAIFTVLFYSGLRASELLNLRLADINRTLKVIHVRGGKGDKDRDVPYPVHLEPLIDRYLELRPPCPDNMALFLSNDGVNGVRGGVAYHGFKMILHRRQRNSGLAKMNLHAFRHGFAMWALNNGMAMSAVSKAMGHASVITTESIYAHWTATGMASEYNAAFKRVTGSNGVST